MTRENYGEAYQQGFNVTRRFLLSRGIPKESASEVTQAAWAKGWERLEQLRNDDMVVTWINAIALNVYRRYLRSERPRFNIPEPRSMPTVNLAAIDMARILRICYPEDRTLLEQEMIGFTPSEIARKRGMAEGAVRIRLFRARRAARLRIEECGMPARRNRAGAYNSRLISSR